MLDFMMPEIYESIRKVCVFHDVDCINGFKFLGRNDATVFEIGLLDGEITEVEIAAGEDIMGVRAKLRNGYNIAIYSDFELMLSK